MNDRVPLLSVIILNWNGKQFLQECLNSLAAQTFSNFEIILVDNGSRDGSVDDVKDLFPGIRLVALSENTGFAEGNNLGLAVTEGQFIVTLNNDTKVVPEFLAELLIAALVAPDIGMVAAKMLNFHQTGRIDSVGVRPTTAGMGINIGVGETDDGQYDEPADVFGPCAGAALYRRDMLEEIGFFDTDFFAYYEDLDLAWRGRLAGWRCVTAPAALVYHVHSATSGRMSPFTVYHVQRNKWFVLLKNWPGGLLLRHLPRILAYDLATVVLAALRGRLIPSLHARLRVLAAIPSLLAKRRKVAQLRRTDIQDIARLVDAGEAPLKIFKRKMGLGV